MNQPPAANTIPALTPQKEKIEKLKPLAFNHVKMPRNQKRPWKKSSRRLAFAATVEEHKLEDGIFLDVKTEDAGRLIGRQGQTLADLQYITNRLLFQQDASSPKVMVDAGGYRAQAREALVKSAKDAAEKVRRWGDAVELEPMSAFDRRMVHQALQGRSRRGNAQCRSGRHGQKGDFAPRPPGLTGFGNKKGANEMVRA